MRIAIILFLLQGFFIFNLQSQSHVLVGKVVDSKTGSPIPFVSIGLKDTFKGTSSNELGEFQFRVDTLPIQLVFNHISYKSQEIILRNESAVEVKLIPSEVVLDEVFVKGKKTDKYLYELIRKAFFRVNRYANRGFYGRAYYRQLSKNGEENTELYEIFYDALYSRRGIVNWAIQEGRYALKQAKESDTYIFNKNFTLLCRVLTMMQPESRDIIHPVNQEAEQNYIFKMKHLMDMEGRRIGVISFHPKKGVTGPAMEGDLYMDVDNYDLLKIKGKIRNDQLKFINLKMKGGSWKNYSLSFDMAYKMSSPDTLMLDYISLDQSFDYYLNDEFKHPVTTHALLSFYDYYVPEKRRRLGGRLGGLWRRDRDVLDKIGYNKIFWEENPIVKRTPVEENVIASFERSRGFGSIYLNNKQQLVLKGNELENDNFIVRLTDSLKQSRYASTGEKIYLHTDKSFYISGETLWFSTYLMNASSHTLSSSSGLVYVELIDSSRSVIIQKRVYIEDGGGYGQIDLPDSLNEGLYQLRAYTNWMRNFDQTWYFSKALTVINIKEHLAKEPSENIEERAVDLQFFAEGGDLIEGIPVQVAFKATQPDGKHMDVTGNIYNSSDKIITGFRSEHLGMGSFIILPQAGESYYAVIKGNEQKYRLAELKSSGFSIMVNVMKPKGIELLIKASVDLDNTDFYLIAQMRNVIFYQYKGRLQNQATRVEIPKSEFPNGILHITLFNAGGIPQCERLVFINNEQTPYVKFYNQDNELEQKEQIEVLLQLKDSEGKPIRNARLSVSVTDAGQAPLPEHEEDIRSWLLLNSDLRGNIESPGYYFEGNDKEHRRDLDLLMLTHGWRRFTWKSILKSATPEYVHAHELGINISGRAYSKGTKKVLDQVYLSFIPTSFGIDGMFDAVTDTEGKFSFQNISVSDTTFYMIQAQNEKGHQLEVKAVIDSIGLPDVIFGKDNSVSLPDQFNIQAVMKGDEYRRFIEELLKDKNTIILDEVTVKPQKKRYDGRLHTTPDVVIKVDEKDKHFFNVLQLLQGRVAGLLITGSGESYKIMMRGYKSINDLNTTPLILIDGVPVNSITPASTSADPDPLEANTSEVDLGISALLSLSMQDVERIEVLKGNAGAIYGSRASKGVIAVYTHRGERPNFYSGKQFELQRVRLPGFSIEREFYMPNYHNNTDDLEKPDYRSTLYWNPDVVISKNGWTNFDFFNNDHAKRLQVVIQGITDDGVPVTAVTWIGE